MRTLASFHSSDMSAGPAMSFEKKQQQHQQQLAAHSAGWHSPVPYLFGGLAAMLGLIAFALLILACSYWKLSGSLESTEDGAGTDEHGEPKHGIKPPAPTTQYPDHHVVVIMAGEEKPTFLATPMSSRASSFGDRSSSSSSSTDESSNQSDQESKPENIESHGHHHHDEQQS